MVASAGQCAVRRLFAVGRWDSAGFLLDSAKAEATITASTTSIGATSISLVVVEVAVGEQTRSTAHEFGGLRCVVGVAARLLEAVKGIVAAAADQVRMAGWSHRVNDTVARGLDAHSHGEAGGQCQDGHEKQFHLKWELVLVEL